MYEGFHDIQLLPSTYYAVRQQNLEYLYEKHMAKVLFLQRIMCVIYFSAKREQQLSA